MFLAEAKRALDRSVADLDRETTVRLQRARLRALEASPARPRWTVWAGGFVVASVALLALLWWDGSLDLARRQPLSMLEDLELVTSTENLELSDNLEFYGWLAEGTTTG